MWNIFLFLFVFVAFFCVCFLWRCSRPAWTGFGTTLVEVSLPMAGVCNKMVFELLSHPKHSVILGLFQGEKPAQLTWARSWLSDLLSLLSNSYRQPHPAVPLANFLGFQIKCTLFSLWIFPNCKVGAFFLRIFASNWNATTKYGTCRAQSKSVFLNPHYPLMLLGRTLIFLHFTLQTKAHRWHLQCSLTLLLRIALEIHQEEIHGLSYRSL